MSLPIFQYHPDPIATGHIIKSDSLCVCCGQTRGYIYTGPVYAEEEYDDCICPWCIADGSAHQKLHVSFTDEAGIGGYGDWCSVSPAIIDEVAYRTPGFFGWQQEQWWTHCNDAAQFLGRVGKQELLAFGTEAITAIQDSIGFDDLTWENVFNRLNKDGLYTAYLFRCQKCGAFGGYEDCY